MSTNNTAIKQMFSRLAQLLVISNDNFATLLIISIDWLSQK